MNQTHERYLRPANLQQAKNLEPIWPIIGKSVVAALWDEFRFAYDNNPEHQNEFDKRFALTILN